MDIDYARAISVLYIVGFWHALDYLPLAPEHKNAVTARITVTMLALFVLVSGYLMGRKSIPLSRASLLAFGRKRFGRIYPPFLLAVALFAVLHISGRMGLLKSALLIASFDGPPPLTLWFIAMICVFYLATPFLLHVRPRPGMFAGVCLAVAGGLVALTLLVPGVDERLAVYFPAYAAGLWLAGQERAAWWVNPVAAVMLAVGLVIGRAVTPDLIPISLLALPLALGGAVLWYRLGEAAKDRLPRSKAVLLVSEGSYFMYLFHRPLYMAMALAMTGTSIGVELGLLVATIGVLITVSVAGQRGYDRAWVAATGG